jgi:hypothetical protein
MYLILGDVVLLQHLDDVPGRERCIFFLLGKPQVSMECATNETNQ